MEAILKRQLDNSKETLGTLIIFKGLDTFICKTLERPWLQNQTGISAIPKGLYRVRMTYSPKFQKMTYEILSVPNRTAIRWHQGNYNTDIEGCVLVGDSFKDINADGLLDIVNSTVTLKALEKFTGGADISLTIL